MDRYVLVTQGEVFHTTEMLAKLEGMERGPAGNTSLAGAICLARELDKAQILVVQETEYTAAGKLPSSQLTFARENGVEVKRGNPDDDQPGKVIIIPETIEQFRLKEYDMAEIRRSYVKKALEITRPYEPGSDDIKFLSKDSKASAEFVSQTIASLSSMATA
jgi:hypothetical protein